MGGSIETNAVYKSHRVGGVEYKSIISFNEIDFHNNAFNSNDSFIEIKGGQIEEIYTSWDSTGDIKHHYTTQFDDIKLTTSNSTFALITPSFSYTTYSTGHTYSLNFQYKFQCGSSFSDFFTYVSFYDGTSSDYLPEGQGQKSFGHCQTDSSAFVQWTNDNDKNRLSDSYLETCINNLYVE